MRGAEVILVSTELACWADELQTIYSALERSLVTEAHRRRVRIELHEPEDDSEPASVLAIADDKRTWEFRREIEVFRRRFTRRAVQSGPRGRFAKARNL